MFLDKQLEFADGAAITSTAVLTNVIDLGDDVTTRNIGGRESLFVVVQCDTSATDSGSDATVTFSLESDSVAALNSSATVHMTSGAIPFASLVGGATLWVAAMPFGQYEQYLGVRATVASGPLTGGTFSAFLTNDPQFWFAYQANNPQAR